MDIKELVEQSHNTALINGFWGNPSHPSRNFAECLMLITSELAEALEHVRNGKDYNSFEVSEEIADAFIRLADLCGGFRIDIEKSIELKMAYNRQRPFKHGKEL
jgi:NTP pyrophosphatase (non-canonical NTP hydrolase)